MGINTQSESQRTNYDTVGKKGEYTRHDSKHRQKASDGDEDALLPAEAGRYHLHISLACPWANGILAALYLKGLEDVISYSTVHPTWGKTKPDDPKDEHRGWVYRSPGDEPLANGFGYGSFVCDDALIPDTITNAKTVRQVYNDCGDDVGPYTTPLLYDKKASRIVSNESMDILPMINSKFNHLAKNPDVNLYPDDEELAKELEELNATLIYPKINNGVYRCGFATSQQAYDIAVSELFEALEIVETKLSKQRYLGGDKFTWLDLRLFETLIRFDPVYITYFKANKKRIADYPNLLAFCRDIYSMEDIKRTVNMDHIKMHYFTSHPKLNPYGIIPAYDGPDLTAPHDRLNF